MAESQENTKLNCDFSWAKFRCLLTNASTGDKEYVMQTRATSPDLKFKYANNDFVFGTGNLHVFKIDAECTVRDQPITIKALKRWTTKYTNLSYAFADEPVTLTWTTTSGLKNWDFICLGPDQEPIMKFSCNVWAMKKIGTIEFIGRPRQALKEELIVTGLTLFYCMVYRSSNLLPFFGAIFAKPGPIVNPTGKDAMSLESVGSSGKAKEHVLAEEVDQPPPPSYSKA